jgi:hypothetical protein
VRRVALVGLATIVVVLALLVAPPVNGAGTP